MPEKPDLVSFVLLFGVSFSWPCFFYFCYNVWHCI